jgi:hypothetical protein
MLLFSFSHCLLKRIAVFGIVFVYASSFNLSLSAVINNATYFNQANDIKIDFESMPGVSGVPGVGAIFSEQYPGLLFRSELRNSPKQNTDKADSLNRFSQKFQFYQGAAGGGTPTSGIRYVSSTNAAGWNVPDMRVDFATPVDAFALWIIDNDFSTARISAYNVSGDLIESVVIPQVSEGGRTYRGIAAPGISYFILDGNNNSDLDSTLLDDLSYRPSLNLEVPEPTSLASSMMTICLLIGRLRHLRLKNRNP